MPSLTLYFSEKEWEIVVQDSICRGISIPQVIKNGYLGNSELSDYLKETSDNIQKEKLLKRMWKDFHKDSYDFFSPGYIIERILKVASLSLKTSGKINMVVVEELIKKFFRIVKVQGEKYSSKMKEELYFVECLKDENFLLDTLRGRPSMMRSLRLRAKRAGLKIEKTESCPPGYSEVLPE